MQTRYLLIFIIALCGISIDSASAQHIGSQEGIPTSALTDYKLDTIARTFVHFRHDVDYIDTNYSDNRASIASLRRALAEVKEDSVTNISSIIVEGSSSPLGHPDYNLRLSYSRAQTVGRFLRSLPGLSDFDIRLVANGEGWKAFIDDIRKSYQRRNRTQLLEILDDESLSGEERKDKIRAMEQDSLTWRILIRDYMNSSRHAVTVVVVRKERIIEPLPEITPQPVSSPEPEPVNEAEQAIEDQKTPEKKPKTDFSPRVPVVTVRSNLLVPFLDAGVEVPLGNSWSVSGDYYYPWIWPGKKNKNCFELLGWSVEGRYWFGRDRQPQDRLKGHSVGVYMAAGYYDFEKNYRGMQGEFLSPGVDYTYSMAVGKAKRVHLQFTLALGYIHSWGRTYDVYGEYGELYPDEGTLMWDYFGPTKAAVSIVVPFYRKEGRR